MKITMKMINLLFAMIIIVIMFAISANALESTGQCGDNVYWNYNNLSGELTINGTGAMYDYNFNNSPFHNTDIKSVIIEKGVENISNSAFVSCNNLTNVLIPNSIVRIGDQAFLNCTNLKSITIPGSIKIINFETFRGCTNLETVIIEEGVTIIDVQAFAECVNLKNIKIPTTITNIYFGAFMDTTDYIEPIKNVYIEDLNSWCDINFEDFDSNPLYPSANLYLNNTLLTELYIPEKAEKIGSYTFICCLSIESLTIPYSVKEIGKTAFNSCKKLTDVYYKGSADEWKNIVINKYNSSLFEANIHYCDHSNQEIYKGTLPTCTKSGISDGVKCLYCNRMITVQTEIPSSGHYYLSNITTSATHHSEGIRTYICITCGDSYTETIAKIKEHSYIASNVVSPSCEKEGYTVYSCQCGESYKDNYTSKTGHKYNSQTCINCGKSCSCNCHKSGFMGFIWKITLFFNKLFKTNKACACGIAHY